MSEVKRTQCPCEFGAEGMGAGLVAGGGEGEDIGVHDTDALHCEVARQLVR